MRGLPHSGDLLGHSWPGFGRIVHSSDRELLACCEFPFWPSALSIPDFLINILFSMIGCRKALQATRALVKQCRFYTVTPEHESLKENLLKLIEKDINPHCPKWEEDRIFPAHEVFKLLGKWTNFTFFEIYIVT